MRPSLAEEWARVRCVLTDIEGTTTALDFVHQTLFPYSAQHLVSFVTSHRNDPEVKACLEQTAQTLANEHPNEPCDEAACLQTLLQWIHNDRKHPALKTLQGLIWKNGYQQGDYQGHVYADVPEALARWQQQGITLAVYSSGSVAAQQLLFAHTPYGDLTPYFSAYFDTAVGGKRDTASYQTIAQQLPFKPSEMLFLSDVPEELEAAQEAGLQVVQLVRDESFYVGGHVPFVVRRNFNEILAPQASAAPLC